MFVWYGGGPATGRTVELPPPAGLGAHGGWYVLVDDGERPTCRYEFVPASMPG
jgi:hypothetical protein